MKSATLIESTELLFIFLIPVFLLAHCYFLSCYLFPTCPLFLFSCHFIHTATQMNLPFFLFLFFPLVHCYFLSCYFFSYLSTVTFFPVTFFPVTFFPTWNCYFLSCYLFSCYFLSVHRIDSTASDWPHNGAKCYVILCYTDCLFCALNKVINTWPASHIERIKSVLVSNMLTNRPMENFKRIFLNEKDWILIEISLKFVPKGTIDNKSAMVQVMSWHRTGHKSLPVPNADPVHRCICATLGGHELN